MELLEHLLVQRLGEQMEGRGREVEEWVREKRGKGEGNVESCCCVRVGGGCVCV